MLSHDMALGLSVLVPDFETKMTACCGLSRLFALERSVPAPRALFEALLSLVRFFLLFCTEERIGDFSHFREGFV
jgi:hypothetical protein